MTLCAFLIFFGSAHAKYMSHSTLMDLPVYTQSLWNTLHGRVMWTTMNYPQGYSHLSDHFTPTLLLFLPLFALHPSPTTLLFIQSFFLAIGAIPIYWISKDKLGKTPATIIATAYLLHPSILYSNLNDFHPLSIATGLAPFAFYYCHKRDYKKFFLFLLPLFGCKEDMMLLGIMFGIYIIFINKDRKIGAITSMGSLAWFLMTLFVIMPYFSAGDFSQTQFYLLSRYSYLGASLTEAITTLLFHPIYILKHTLIPMKLIYFLTLLFPTAFLALPSTQTLLIIFPTFMANILSNHIQNYAITSQYTTVMIPFLFTATTFTIDRYHEHKSELVMLVLFMSLLSTTIYGPVGIIQHIDIGPDSHHKHVSYTMSEGDRYIEATIKGIPKDASIAASSNLIIHFPMREGMYQLFYINKHPEFLEENEVDYVLIDTNSYLYEKFGLSNTKKYILPNYTILKSEYGYILLRRNTYEEDFCGIANVQRV